ncbi:nitrate reductase associated protein [Leptolyngbya cf. ectocarpi LEGE 11479]|uniref:Nitrate reductase associated protein n=1 Tax=Leptolyngbya cf. ectocarpi LEGE 11479 TaxID=1828722 RepID=A0A928WXW7_LEPEC|nr:nitrate reductase associated protein [Leptolyngbya ectocarpi]MBE9065475.1 nitrate reductase associated protein [Leptolyngbya cf. ectocarpi LEGE 11479]
MESGGFQFEQEFIESLRCIPMVVRMKLDTCGVKLKLTHWHRFSHPERQTLVTMPCEHRDAIAAYQQYLQGLVTHYTGQPAKEIDVPDHPAWLETAVPASVKHQATAHRVEISTDAWQGLTPAQRFALIKLSRPSHENRNFVPALQEFGLAD